MRIAKEEVFGPVLSIIGFEDEADAVRLASDTIYGLGGGRLDEGHGPCDPHVLRAQGGHRLDQYLQDDWLYDAGRHEAFRDLIATTTIPGTL